MVESQSKSISGSDSGENQFASKRAGAQALFDLVRLLARKSAREAHYQNTAQKGTE